MKFEYIKQLMARQKDLQYRRECERMCSYAIKHIFKQFCDMDLQKSEIIA